MRQQPRKGDSDFDRVFAITIKSRFQTRRVLRLRTSCIRRAPLMSVFDGSLKSSALIAARRLEAAFGDRVDTRRGALGASPRLPARRRGSGPTYLSSL